jgi:ribulose-5-phosphate 4-epimerase/fuculose-1-phosphate aldolase
MSLSIKPKSALTPIEILRIDLAAALRLCVQFGWEEAVGNHFSAATSADGKRFLLNPRWRHFSTITASCLQEWDSAQADVMNTASAPDPSAWCLHGTLHREVPEARVLLHCHPPYLSALMALKSPDLLPVDQNSARFFERTAIDHEYGGLADDAVEAKRVARLLKTAPIVLMGNHGVMVSAATVAMAFDELYFLERAARTLLWAYQSGQPLAVLSPAVARRTRDGWGAYAGAAVSHFEHLKSQLALADPNFAV